MSKKKSKKKSSWKVPNVGAAMRAANSRGQYGSAIATKAMIEALGKATKAMSVSKSGRMKSPKRKLSKAEKAARKRVQGARAAYATAAARAARLGGKKRKRSKVAKKKTTRRVAAPAATRKASAPRKPKVPTVTANSVINNAAKQALRRWLCEGARRSGCGAGGSRVVTGKGSFVRIRPPRFMTAGGK